MTRLLLIIVFVATFVAANAQFLHNRESIQKIMERSEHIYIMDTLQNSSLKMDYPVIQGFHDDTFVSTESKAKKYHISARKALKKNKTQKAKKNYHLALEVEPNNKLVQLELAKLYEATNEHAQAILIYKEQLQESPLDFNLHQKIAACYYKNGYREKAINHLFKGHLYNRNHVEIRKELIRLLELEGYQYEDWSLNPVYKVEQKPNKEIAVVFEDSTWGAYAACKAVWAYEEGYSDQMKYLSDINSIEMIEAKECLFNAMLAAEASNANDKYPELKSMTDAIDKGLLDEYVFYELLSREKPEITFSLPPEKIDDLIRYVKVMHLKQLDN